MSLIGLPKPYLLFLGDVTEAPFAKTAFGLRDWFAARLNLPVADPLHPCDEFNRLVDSCLA